MVYSNTNRLFFLSVVCLLLNYSCKKEVPIEFPYTDETIFLGQDQGIQGKKWVNISIFPSKQALSMNVVGDNMLITLTGGNAAVSLLYGQGSFSSTNQTINDFNGLGTGVSKVKRVNQKWYGMGQMGNYGLFEYDSTLNYAPWDPVSNLNAVIHGFEIVNSISYVGCGSAPYVRYNQSGTWLTVGNGLDNVVYDLTVYNGELIAAGNFVNSGSTVLNHIARWNGSQWLPMDGGLNGVVRDLEIYNGKLVAVGGFTSTTNGNADCKNVAVWDGTSWAPLSNGLSGGYYGGLTAFAYKNELFIGGDFSSGGNVLSPNIIKWNGNSFKALANGVNDPIGAITVFQESLYVSNSAFFLNSNFILRLSN